MKNYTLKQSKKGTVIPFPIERVKKSKKRERKKCKVYSMEKHFTDKFEMIESEKEKMIQYYCKRHNLDRNCSIEVQYLLFMLKGNYKWNYMQKEIEKENERLELC